MEIYLLLIILIITQGVVLFYKGYNETNIKIYLIIVFFEMLLITGFRSYKIGNDTMSYVNFFNILDSGSYEISKHIYYEKGFVLFNIILSILFNGEQTILFFSSLFILALLSRYIYINSKIPWLSIYIYITLMFFFASMNIMRQYIAIVIILNSLKYVLNKKPIKFGILVLIASTFHSTAIVFLPIYILNKIQFNKKTFKIAIIMSSILMILFPIIINISMYLFNRYSNYSQYIGSNKFGNILRSLVWISVLMFGIVVQKKNIKSNKLTNMESINFWIMFIGTAISIAAIKMSILSRVDAYFTIFSISFIPNLIVKINNRKIKHLVIHTIMSISFIYFYVVMTLRPEWYNAIPYISCF